MNGEKRLGFGDGMKMKIKFLFPLVAVFVFLFGMRALAASPEERVLELVNQERAKVGAAPLKMSASIQVAANMRAKELPKLFDHQRPDGSSCFTALDEVGVTYTAAGENIAAGYPTPEAVMDGWMNSDGHRSNILSTDFNSIGIGYYVEDGYPYWVQLFAYTHEHTYQNGSCTQCGSAQPMIEYRTHIQDVGWQEWKGESQVSGTYGLSKRLEAIEIKKGNLNLDGSIRYSTHIQDIGWQEWKADGELSGTSGQSKRLEAIKIQLTGELSEAYDIYYRVHAQDFGWLGWAKNGEVSGTSGYGKRLEAIEIQLVSKGGAAPGSTADAYKYPLVTYRVHAQDYGWLGYVNDGATGGTTGQSKRLEGIQIYVSNEEYSGGIEYCTHIQDIGWQEWKHDKEMSGTSGQSKRLEAIRIRLTGEMEEQYDVYYRVHAQDFGWMGWAKNGEQAGTAGYAKRLEGIQIRLVEKGGAAPGSSENAFVQK